MCTRGLILIGASMPYSQHSTRHSQGSVYYSDGFHGNETVPAASALQTATLGSCPICTAQAWAGLTLVSEMFWMPMLGFDVLLLCEYLALVSHSSKAWTPATMQEAVSG